MTDWQYFGDFSSSNNQPTVVLDQNTSMRKLAEILYQVDIRVARALNHHQIPDTEIISEAERYHNCIVITMDGGFSEYPRALIVPPRGKLKRNCETLVEDIKYIFGVVNVPSRHYRSSNGNHKTPREDAYWDRVDSLRGSRIK